MCIDQLLKQQSLLRIEFLVFFVLTRLIWSLKQQQKQQQPIKTNFGEKSFLKIVSKINKKTFFVSTPISLYCDDTWNPQTSTEKKSIKSSYNFNIPPKKNISQLTSYLVELIIYLA